MNEGLIIAAIAAGSALLGSAVGQLGPLLQHWLSARHARRVVLRERYERMATLCGALIVHLDRRVERAIAEEPRQAGADLLQATSEMCTLALLYFPELLEAAETLHREGMKVDLILDHEMGEQSRQTAQAFHAARRAATDLIRQNASRYT